MTKKEKIKVLHRLLRDTDQRPPLDLSGLTDGQLRQIGAIQGKYAHLASITALDLTEGERAFLDTCIKLVK